MLLYQYSKNKACGFYSVNYLNASKTSLTLRYQILTEAN